MSSGGMVSQATKSLVSMEFLTRGGVKIHPPEDKQLEAEGK